MSYDSKPQQRQGEPLEEVLPQAIRTTASGKREGRGRKGRRAPGPGPFLVLGAVCVVLAVLLIVSLLI